MSPGPTFDRVYLALKEQLMSGRFAPGDHLEPAAISGGVNASVTPVRDALHRLVGERIVETPRHDGFKVPAPTEAELRDLYGWNFNLLDLALRHARRRPVPRGAAGDALTPAAGDGAVATADIFLEIARWSGSGEHVAAIKLLNERLGPMREAEERLLDGLDSERADLRALLASADLASLRRALATYHRRRQRSVSELLVAMRERDLRS